MQIHVSSLSKQLFACAMFSQACAGTQPDDSALQLASAQALATDYYRPSARTSWQIQLQGKLDTNVSADLYDVDLFDTDKSEIAALHAQGRRVICYFDTAYEPWRPDAKALEPFRAKAMDGWPGQYWLDVKSEVVRGVMWDRIELAAAKGCDGVDADDVDMVGNDTGLSLFRNEQQEFIILLARLAHANGLAFGLKNDLGDIPRLEQYVDFAINEQCLEYRECDAMKPFTEAGKPVFHIEYSDGNFADAATTICARSKALGFRTLIKDLDLDAPSYACP